MSAHHTRNNAILLTPEECIHNIRVMIRHAQEEKQLNVIRTKARSEILTQSLSQGANAIAKYMDRCCGKEQYINMIDYLIRKNSSLIVLDGGIGEALNCAIRALQIEDKEHKFKRYSYDYNQRKKDLEEW